jgi:hypothetical protein
MHDDDRLAGERAVLLPIDPMLGKSWRSQMPDRMKGGFAGWLFDVAVWALVSTEIISATKGR